MTSQVKTSIHTHTHIHTYTQTYTYTHCTILQLDHDYVPSHDQARFEKQKKLLEASLGRENQTNQSDFSALALWLEVRMNIGEDLQPLSDRDKQFYWGWRLSRFLQPMKRADTILQLDRDKLHNPVQNDKNRRSFWKLLWTEKTKKIRVISLPLHSDWRK